MTNEIALAGARDMEKPTPGMRTIEEITAEAIRHQMEGADAVIALGNCLIEAKAQLSHGEWLPWLSENLNLSDRVAQHLMLIARNCSNTNALSYLGKTKVLTILALPPDERALFLDGDYVPEGADKSVSEMTTRELQQVIRERDAANRERDNARRQLEHSQANLKSANKQIDDLCEQLGKRRKSEEAALAQASAAEKSRLKAEENMRRANAELEELRSRPTDVAIQYQRDEAAIEAAREEVRAEMQGKLDEANATAQAASEAENRLRQELSEAQADAKKAVVDGDKDLAVFNVYFVQAQELADKMRNAFLAIREKDPERAGKLVNAVEALKGVIGGITA